MQKSNKAFLVTSAIVIAVAFLGSAVSSRTARQKKSAPTIPTIVSKIRTIQIVSSRVVDEDTPGVGVEIVVRNESPKAVMAIDLVAGEGAVTKNGLTDEKNPIVVIEPNGTATLGMTFGEMSPGASLVISAVVYEDGTEEGDAEPLRIIRKIRERDNAKTRTARGYKVE